MHCIHVDILNGVGSESIKAMAIRRAALHISSVAMLIRRAALHISSVAMLIRRAALHTSKCLFAEQLCT